MMLFFNRISQLGFTQFVDELTRLNNSSIGNTLDLIFSNDPMSINITNYSPPISSSDHCIVNFNVFSCSTENNSNSDVNNSTTITELTVFDWSNADFAGINIYLRGIDWNCVFGFNFNADSIWNAFKSTIWPIIAMFVPRKTVPHHLKYRPRQYPKHIRRLLTKKSAIWHKLKTNKSPELLSTYQNNC